MGPQQRIPFQQPPQKTGMRHHPTPPKKTFPEVGCAPRALRDSALSWFFPFPAASKPKAQLFLPKTGMFCCGHLGTKPEFGAGTGSKLVWLSQFGVGFTAAPTERAQGIQARRTPAGFGWIRLEIWPRAGVGGGTLREAQPHPRGKTRMAAAPGELQNSQPLERGCQSIRVTTMVRKSS